MPAALRPPFARVLLFISALVTSACFGVTSAQAQTSAGPSNEPQLRIEAGMHTAMINRIATDAAGRFAVTASDDKTARVWDIASGQLLQVLRPPIAPGNEGKLYAVALSPDARTVAVGGWTGVWDKRTSVYLFDRSSGQLLQRLSGLPNVIHHLAYSPDGRYLAATLGGWSGVRVWPLNAQGQASNPTQPLADTYYADSSYGAHWSQDGRLATTSYDGALRLYRVQSGQLQREQKQTSPVGKQPSGIAFSPDGQHLAVGYRDSARVDVLDAKTLRLRYSANTKGTNNDLGNVAWSADGQWLLAAGSYRQNGRQPVRLWQAQGQGAAQDLITSNSTVMDLAPLPDGRLLLGAADPAWGLLTPQPVSAWRLLMPQPAWAWQAQQQSPIADLRSSEGDNGFAISANAQRVQFGYKYDVNKAPLCST